MTMVAERPRRRRAFQYTALSAYLLFLAFPLLWLLSTAFKGPREMARLHPTLIPHAPTLDNFSAALHEQALVHSAWNSVKVSVAAAVLTVLLALPAAYALARFRSRLNRVALGWVVLSQIFPLILIIIPLFLILRDLHLVDTHLGLIIVYVVWSLPFALWLLRGYVQGIPVELEEAAATDGAGRLRILVSIVAPLLAPGIVVTLLFSFISAWNEFFLALVVLNDPEQATLSLTLARFLGKEGVADLGPLAAASVLATIPSLVLFGVIQRRLTSGLLSGAVKG
ncbi:Diacetylchitobiose uptake system permease protein DasC [Baekduia alba]|uniref:carbohydrate ABC transporter permease n=1 Tax=Baekduia alba TaxID=2997333 RepID=UPI0023404795|nr:carbohydrate ABC transporter permease [Baekduia alba]WCB93415.1 Diacetylchitobiose uptake system permease protein DasC [Baekduia alba]